MHLLDTLERPIIFAHRGASVSAPENTMAAFHLAVKLGVKAIELDTMLSRDGTPVVIHDHTLERTTNGKGHVSDLDYSNLSQLDAGAWYSKNFEGEKIPSLNQVLESFSNRILINIELKNYHAPHDALAETVMRLVDELNVWDAVLFSSFLPRNLRLIRAKKPGAKTALLCPSGIKGRIFRSSLYMDISPEFIHPEINDVNRKYIEREHERSRRVHVWTVNHISIANDLFINKVDGIFTDDPEIMLKVIS
jgi:glycerophosphoryl diester phosphodiesterase